MVQSANLTCLFGSLSVRILSGRLPESPILTKPGRTPMKRVVATTALCLALALSLLAPTGMAGTETRKEALKVCHDLYVQSIKTADDSYNAALKDAKSKRGKARKDAMAAASKARTESK